MNLSSVHYNSLPSIDGHTHQLLALFRWLVLQVNKFLDKNFDMVRQDVLDLFTQSKNRVRRANTLSHPYISRSLLLCCIPMKVLSCAVDLSSTSIQIQMCSIVSELIYCMNTLCVRVQMVSRLFLRHSESVSQQRANVRHSSTARRYQANTVSAKFQSSLQELLEKMERFVQNTSHSIWRTM